MKKLQYVSVFINSLATLYQLSISSVAALYQLSNSPLSALYQCHKRSLKPYTIPNTLNRSHVFSCSGKRARELFAALDEDGSGSLTEDEFIDGCMTDEAFVQLLRDFNGDFIWES